jgi:DNA-binding XRE family transcriptional regulator
MNGRPKESDMADLQDVERLMTRARDLEAELAQVRNALRDAMRDANASGVSQNTLAKALGISRQRVAQIMRD